MNYRTSPIKLLSCASLTFFALIGNVSAQTKITSTVTDNASITGLTADGNYFSLSFNYTKTTQNGTVTYEAGHFFVSEGFNSYGGDIAPSAFTFNNSAGIFQANYSTGGCIGGILINADASKSTMETKSKNYYLNLESGKKEKISANSSFKDIQGLSGSICGQPIVALSFGYMNESTQTILNQ